MRLTWLSDIHLEFLSDDDRSAFLCELDGQAADAVLIGGDIATAESLGPILDEIASAVSKPVYFVLGNHDYYHGSVLGSQALARTASARAAHLHFLDDLGAIRLNGSAALVGVGGWYDTRTGNYENTDIRLNDFLLIEDLVGLAGSALASRLMQLADADGARLGAALNDAARRASRVIVLTHVPPFLAACWHEGAISDENWAPFFTSKATGDALIEVADAHPTVHFEVLCGHTHGQGHAQIRDNLEVWTAGAVYGQPCVEREFEV